MSGRGGTESEFGLGRPGYDIAQMQNKPEIPMFNPEIKEQGFSVFGFVKLADASLILTFDQDNFLHIYQAEGYAYRGEKSLLNRDENIEIAMPHIELKDFNIVQIGGLEAPETKKAARVSQRGEDHYKFYAIDGVTQEEREEIIPADTVHDLFFDRSADGLPDEAGFFEFKPGAQDSVIAATFANHIKQDSATVFIIQPEVERTGAGTVQYNSQLGLTILLQNIRDAIMFNSTADQDQVDLIIKMAIDEDLINYEVPQAGVNQKNFNDILRLVWHLRILIDTADLKLRGQSYMQDEAIREAVPWIIWGELNSFKKWLYKNQPTVTLKADSWQDLLVDYKDFATVNYDLSDPENPNDITENKNLILNLENLMAEIMKNATDAQQTANRAIKRAIKNGKVRFENDNNLASTQERNYILTLIWRIDVLTRVYQAEQNDRLQSDTDLERLIPWVKWDRLSRSTVGMAVRWFYQDPVVSLSQEEWQSELDHYKKQFKQVRRADWRREVEAEKRRRERY